MLGLGAGYLINKKMIIQGQLHELVNQFHNAAQPSDNGTTSAEIRTTYKNVEHPCQTIQNINHIKVLKTVTIKC